MSNMSYCRFQNTYHDFEECRIAVETILEGGHGDEDDSESPLSDEELDAARRLISSAIELIESLVNAGETRAMLRNSLFDFAGMNGISTRLGDVLAAANKELDDFKEEDEEDEEGVPVTINAQSLREDHHSDSYGRSATDE